MRFLPIGEAKRIPRFAGELAIAMMPAQSAVAELEGRPRSALSTIRKTPFSLWNG